MDDKPRETQPDLFQEHGAVSQKTERFPSIIKTHKPILISTTLEQLLTASVVAILVLCGIFFLGVLRGKGLNKTEIQTMQIPPAAARPANRPLTVLTPPFTAKPYTIQLAMYRKKEYAEAEMGALKKMGFTSFLISGGGYYQVCIGQYASKEDAKKDLSRFASKYKDSYLRRR